MSLSYALTTTAQAKTYLGISTTDYDDVLELLIDSATEMIESYCRGRRFAETTYTDEEMDGNDKYEFLLPQYPVTDIVSLTIDDTLISSSDYIVLEEEGVVRSNYQFKFQWDEQVIKVTYSAGYKEIPKDLELA